MRTATVLSACLDRALRVFQRSWRAVTGTVLRITRDAANVVRGVGFAIGIVFAGLGFSAAVVAIVVGFWDVLVWLFNADWRTSHFKASLWGLAVCIVAGIVAVMAEQVVNWTEQAAKVLEQKVGVAAQKPPDQG